VVPSNLPTHFGLPANRISAAIHPLKWTAHNRIPGLATASRKLSHFASDPRPDTPLISIPSVNLKACLRLPGTIGKPGHLKVIANDECFRGRHEEHTYLLRDRRQFRFGVELAPAYERAPLVSFWRSSVNSGKSASGGFTGRAVFRLSKVARMAEQRTGPENSNCLARVQTS